MAAAGRVYTEGQRVLDEDLHDVEGAGASEGLVGLLLEASHSGFTDEPNTIAGITTLNECTATGYNRVALSTVAIEEDTGNRRIEITADDPSFGYTAPNGSVCVALLLCLKKSATLSDNTHVPFAILPFTDNKTLTGTSLVVPLPSGNFSNGYCWRYSLPAGSQS